MSDANAAELWGTLGRKVDPTGIRTDKQKIIDVDLVRAAVAARLRDPDHGESHDTQPME